MREVLIILVLIICSVADLKKGEIEFYWLLPMIGIRFLEAYFFLFLFILFYSKIEDYIGGADVIIFLLLYSNYGRETILLMISISSLLGISYMILFKKRKMRFIPCILISFLSFLVIREWGII